MECSKPLVDRYHTISAIVDYKKFVVKVMHKVAGLDGSTVCQYNPLESAMTLGGAKCRQLHVEDDVEWVRWDDPMQQYA